MITDKKTTEDLDSILKHWRNILIKNEFPTPATVSIIKSDIEQWKKRHVWIFRKDKKDKK